MAAPYYALGNGPRKKFQPLLSRRCELHTKTFWYEADPAGEAYALNDLFHFGTVPKGAIITAVELHSPTGFGTGMSVDIGTISGTVHTAFSDLSAQGESVTDGSRNIVVLTESETIDTSTELTVGLKITVAPSVQPAVGDYMILMVQYIEMTYDFPD